MKYLFNKIFSKEQDVVYNIYKIFGIKIKLKKYDKNLSKFSEAIARETYSALEVSKLHSKVFPQFRHCNYGKNVTIIGCGPTIKYYNNEADFVNIGLNKAILLENINFDSTFCFDSGILEKCPGYLKLIKEKKYKKFIGKFLHPEFDYNFPEIIDEDKFNIYRYYGSKRHGFPNLREFEYSLHTDISTYPLADFYSVSFAALHYALYTYPSKIYLVGLDTAQTGNFFDGNTSYNYKKMIMGYKFFKKFAQIYYPETEIISVNPIGLKGLYRDVYTRSYVDKHPELLNENIEIIEEIV